MGSYETNAVAVIIATVVLCSIALFVMVRISQRRLVNEIIGEIRQQAQVLLSRKRAESDNDHDMGNPNG